MQQKKFPIYANNTFSFFFCQQFSCKSTINQNTTLTNCCCKLHFVAIFTLHLSFFITFHSFISCFVFGEIDKFALYAIQATKPTDRPTNSLIHHRTNQIIQRKFEADLVITFLCICIEKS